MCRTSAVQKLPQARDVLRHWRVRSTEDFGKIVFAMVDAGFVRKSDEDSMRDFIGVYTFEEAFSGLERSTPVDSA